MKKIVLTLALASFAVSASAEVVEAVLARVGDRIVTRSQYLTRLDDGYREIERTLPQAEAAKRKEEYRKTLLDEMLAEVLIKDRADRLGIGVTAQEIKDAIGRLMTQYNMESEDAFNQSLLDAGLTRSEMEARLRDSLLTNKVFGRELRSREQISDRELRERYEREKDAYRMPERATLREIVMVVPAGSDSATKEAARARAEQAAARALAGEDFATLAAELSDSPSKAQGGDIGTVAKGELLATLDAAVFAAPAGSIAGPVETAAGFHVLRVEQRHPSEIPSFDAIKDQLRRGADEETFQRDYKAYIERLRTDAFVHVFAENLPTV
ncbi:MAG TPA: peptidylprolyl isomerase [Thermoanaerobaculia bacterium]|nr:peptidylprolyl isomerase [Thermoanaerobaculia bacterium]